MSRAMRVLGVLLPFMAAVASCGGGYTAGDACSTVGTAECNRFAQCDLLSTSVSSCKSMFQTQCCGTQCGETAPSKEEEDLAKQIVNECADAFRTFSCDLISQGYIPAECDFIGYAAAPPWFASRCSPTSSRRRRRSRKPSFVSPRP